MKLFRILLLLCLPLLLSAEEDARFLWHDPEASCRLKFRQASAEEPGVIDDRMLCLPVSFANGVRVFDTDGNTIPVHDWESGAVLIPATLREQTFFLYFGYQKKLPRSTFPGKKTNKRLAMYRSPHQPAYKVAEWHNVECNAQRNNLKRRTGGIKPCPPCDPKKCRTILQLGRTCKNALLPFCAWNVIARYHSEKTLLWAKDPLLRFRITCCRGLLLRPDFALLPTKHNTCFEARQKTSIRRYSAEKRKTENAIRKILDTDPAQGLQDQLLHIGQQVVHGEWEYAQLSLTRQPTDTGVRSLLYFKGSLYVPETGSYTFRVSSNATHLLSIDGECIMRRFTEDLDRSGDMHTDTEITLEKGLHDFILGYQKKHIGTWIAASWKQPGNPFFQVLAEENFAPGLPVKPLELETQSGIRYPMVTFSDKIAIFTGKRDRKTVRIYNNAVPAQGDVKFRFNGKDYTEEQNVFLTETDVPGIEIIPDNPELTPMKIHDHKRRSKRLTVPLSLRIGLHLPDFIYDDERLNGTMEIRSRLPFEVTPCLSLTRNGKTMDEFLHIPAHQDENMDRFSPDFLLKRDFPLIARGDDNAGDFRYDLKIADFPVSSVTCSFRFPGDPAPFLYRNGNFLDENGERIVMVLHRPELHELRTWSLPKNLSAGLKKTKKLFLVGDFPDEVRAALLEKWEQNGVEVIYAPVLKDHESSGSPLPESLYRLSTAMRESGADTVLLVPPSISRAMNHSMRTELRCLAYLLEQARNTKNIRRILLSTPMPASGEHGENVRKYEANLRSLKRDYGIFCLELGALLRETEKEEYVNAILRLLTDEI